MTSRPAGASVVTEFVAVAAHEFRTPLAAILGVLTTLRTHGDSLDAELREELLDGATSQAARLARLVDDILTVSRLDDGALRLEVKPEEPRRLLAEAAQASGTAHLVDVELGRVGPVRCDADAIVRVLTNLLDNARKYSPEGARITVSVEQDDRAIRFAVADAGPGVPPSARRAIFERFRRLDGNGNKPGAGLGLFIARRLVQAHRGSIHVGKGRAGGAEFSFTIPRKPPSSAGPPLGNGSRSIVRSVTDARSADG